MLGRYEENAYLWRMMQVVGHPDTTIMELDGYNHGQMAQPAHPLLLRFINASSKPSSACARPHKRWKLGKQREKMNNEKQKKVRKPKTRMNNRRRLGHRCRLGLIGPRAWLGNQALILRPFWFAPAAIKITLSL